MKVKPQKRILRKKFTDVLNKHEVFYPRTEREVARVKKLNKDLVKVAIDNFKRLF